MHILMPKYRDFSAFIQADRFADIGHQIFGGNVLFSLLKNGARGILL